MQLLKRFSISRLTRLARPGGTAISKAIIDLMNQLNYPIYIAYNYVKLHYLEFYCDLMSASLH